MADEKNSTIKYLPDPGLKAAAEVALELGVPLLVTGEPGTGKTELAYWIAGTLGTTVLRFNTKTISQSKDLFYRYDAIRHFRDSQNKQVNPLNYIQFDALGKAILASSKKRFVVLVDEIDKAPRDFPNDLLFEFEKLAFNISEASRAELDDRTFDWKNKPELKGLDIGKPPFDENGNIVHDPERPRPVLVLTSNSEKNLPEAFLRRCAFYHIPFPPPDRLLEIIKIHGFLDEKFPVSLAEKAVDYFTQIREQGLRKKPATAELLAWLHILKRWDIDPTKAGVDKELENRIRQTLSLLAKNKEDMERLSEDFKF
jgi:MoxR-like ATPase